MSATPDREYGEEGNKFIKSELGETFHRFGLKEAIQKKFCVQWTILLRNTFYLMRKEIRCKI